MHPDDALEALGITQHDKGVIRAAGIDPHSAGVIDAAKMGTPVADIPLHVRLARDVALRTVLSEAEALQHIAHLHVAWGIPWRPAQGVVMRIAEGGGR